MRKRSKEIDLDSRVNETTFNVMVDLLERGVIQENQIKKPLYKTEYGKIKAKKVK